MELDNRTYSVSRHECFTIEIEKGTIITNSGYLLGNAKHVVNVDSLRKYNNSIVDKLQKV